MSGAGEAVLGSQPEKASAGGAPWSAEQAERYLLGLERFGMHFGLEKMRRLMGALGSPHERFASIHVVGTNGKSSTTRMIAAILERHGVHSGSYTSPHLVSFTERIQVGERDLADERFGLAVQRVADAAAGVDAATGADGDPVTQFEALTAAAYAELAAAGVDVGVIEAGLGARYDATSVIDPRVTVLTNIGLEHTAWLGETIAAIAGEKLAVVSPGGVLVVGAGLHADALAVARSIAAERGARVVEAPATLVAGIRLGARGDYQRRNFALAIAAAEAYLGAPLDAQGVSRAGAELVVAGRFEVLVDLPSRAGGRTVGARPGSARSPAAGGGRAVTLLDGAHNPAGIDALVESLPAFLDGRRLCAVVSILDDKDARSMLGALLPLCERVICTTASNPRAVPADALAAVARDVLGPRAAAVEVEVDPRRAVGLGRELVPGGVVVVTGSIYLISDVVRGSRPGSTL
ncbi:MAG TPA: Mur ligase family protein [Solirubrobacteraceae bacterium]|nr:Mur ligase family protein [Solirubrobacteraceae bacterium]